MTEKNPLNTLNLQYSEDNRTLIKVTGYEKLPKEYREYLHLKREAIQDVYDYISERYESTLSDLYELQFEGDPPYDWFRRYVKECESKVRSYIKEEKKYDFDENLISFILGKILYRRIAR